MLRQRSRPYLFSNSVAPAIVGASLEMFRMLDESDELHDRLMGNVEYFRTKMLEAGFDIKPTQRAICAERGDPCDGILLSGGAEGRGPHPRTAQRGSQPRAAGPRHQRLHQGGQEVRSAEGLSAVAEAPARNKTAWNIRNWNQGEVAERPLRFLVGEVDGEAEAEFAGIDGIAGHREVIAAEPVLINVAA